MSQNPELRPLKEAVQRAHERREEAAGIREALEAEAQEVAQLAVNAESTLSNVVKLLEEAEMEFKTTDELFEGLKSAVAHIQLQLQEGADDAMLGGKAVAEGTEEVSF